MRTGLAQKGLLTVVLILAAIQLVPYGRNHSNPPARMEPVWDRPETRELARRACFDCHSNETRWPAYAQIAPISWLVQHDVDEGREELNFSEWQRPQQERTEAPATVRDKEMPPRTYTLLHPEARLTTEERADLVRGLQSTIGADASNKSDGSKD